MDTDMAPPAVKGKAKKGASHKKKGKNAMDSDDSDSDAEDNDLTGLGIDFSETAGEDDGVCAFRGTPVAAHFCMVQGPRCVLYHCAT